MKAAAIVLSVFLFFSLSVSAQPAPVVCDGCVVNAASFAKDANGHGSPMAPGSLVSIFGSNLSVSPASADTVPFSTSLGGVSVTFNNIPAPIKDLIPNAQFPFLNVIMPFGVLAPGVTSANVNVVVTVNGMISDPKPVPIVAIAPGIFTNPPGVGQAILVNLADNSIAGPVSAAGSFGPVIPVHPIPRGQAAYFYATGLGAMTPPLLSDGDAGTDREHDAVVTPLVLVGGISAKVLYAGASGFPGVNQINIIIPNGAPTGDFVDLQIQTADGTLTTAPKVSTIAIQ